MSTSVEYLPSETKRERKMVVVERELEKIYKAHDNITADLVVEEARNKKHPLHSYFEWDDTAAAEKYRKAQAYTLIMASKFVVRLVEDGKVKASGVPETARVRKLVNAFRGEGFTMRIDALADTEKRAAMIETKKGVLRSWCESVIDIEELQPLRKIILKHL